MDSIIDARTARQELARTIRSIAGSAARTTEQAESQAALGISEEDGGVDLSGAGWFILDVSALDIGGFGQL